jgi:hypothetical protein
MMQANAQPRDRTQSDTEQRRKRAIAANAALWNPATESVTELEIKNCPGQSMSADMTVIQR